MKIIIFTLLCCIPLTLLCENVNYDEFIPIPEGYKVKITVEFKGGVQNTCEVLINGITYNLETGQKKTTSRFEINQRNKNLNFQLPSNTNLIITYCVRFKDDFSVIYFNEDDPIFKVENFNTLTFPSFSQVNNITQPTPSNTLYFKKGFRPDPTLSRGINKKIYFDKSNILQFASDELESEISTSILGVNALLHSTFIPDTFRIANNDISSDVIVKIIQRGNGTISNEISSHLNDTIWIFKENVGNIILLTHEILHNYGLSDDLFDLISTKDLYLDGSENHDANYMNQPHRQIITNGESNFNLTIKQMFTANS